MQYSKKIKLLLVLGLVLLAAVFSQLSKSYVVPILMFHHIEQTTPPKADSVSPENFAKEMAYIKEKGYHVISMDQLIDEIETDKRIDRKKVVITFDDGYKDNFTNAFPVLKQYGFPAIIFIIPEKINQDGYLTWEDIKEMEKSRITFGSHTVDHTYLPDISAQEQERQIFLSKQMIEEKLGHSISFFCYPSGGFSDSIKKMVQKTGYRAAVTTNRGSARLNDDLYELKRIKFNDKTANDFYLWAKLSGYYHLFRSFKKPY